jgi:DNA-binding beta-propeller fold protein YncE
LQNSRTGDATSRRLKKGTRTSPLRFPVSALVLVFAATVLGAKPKSVEPKPSRVWPPPPEKARVIWVQDILKPSDVGAKESGFTHAANWFSGDNKGNESFARPFGIALDENDNLCLTDTGANTVSFFDRKSKQWKRWQSIEKIRFAAPVAVAKHGDLICVADSASAKIIAFSPDRKLRFQITNQLQRPSGLAIHGDRLHVADAQRHAILIFDLNGKFISSFGQRGVKPGEFNYPSHVLVNATGKIYVTDSMNSRVQVFDADGKFLQQIGGAGDGPGFFSRPKGVSVDRFGHIYVLDGLADNIQVFDGNGRLLLNLGEAGHGPGEFWLPNGIAIGQDNKIYVTDSYNLRVQVFEYVGDK